MHLLIFFCLKVHGTSVFGKDEPPTWGGRCHPPAAVGVAALEVLELLERCVAGGEAPPWIGPRGRAVLRKVGDAYVVPVGGRHDYLMAANEHIMIMALHPDDT